MEMILECRRVGRTCIVKLSRWAMPEVCSSAFVRDGYLLCERSEIGDRKENSRRVGRLSSRLPTLIFVTYIPLLNYIIISPPTNRRPVSGLQTSTNLPHGARVPSLQISHLGTNTVIYEQMTFNSISLHRSGIIVRCAEPEMQETHTKIYMNTACSTILRTSTSSKPKKKPHGKRSESRG